MMSMDPKWLGDLPPSMSAGAPDVDVVYNAIYWFCVVFFVVSMAVMFLFVMKYRRKKGDKLHLPSDFTKLEIAWTVAPVFFIVALFHYGFRGYVRNAVAAPDALEIRVYGKQWLWEFEYPNGMREIGTLHLPSNRSVKLIMSSDDVIHSFYIPEFRIKKDVVPGMYSALAFRTTSPGSAHVFCAEFCGTTHSGMLADVKIMEPKEFEDLLKEGPKLEGTPEEAGQKLFAKNGCVACHAVDGVTKSPGPNLKGVYGRHEEFEATANYSGPGLEVDENYIKESIRKPQAKTVKGYGGVVMPTFTLPDRQIDAIIAYLKTLK